MPVRIERLTADALRRFLPELARLRIAVFRAYPYLYAGDQAYEERYLATYATAPGSAVFAALDGDRVVGASTALPLAGETGDITRPFREHGLDVAQFCYFGESVLLPEYRGQGIGVAFFDRREAHAHALGLQTACFCAVARPADHPQRPAGHVPLDGFWRRRGYEPVPGLTCYISWRDLGEAGETAKPMTFWSKDLTR